jgi:RNA polymerase sigma factor (sigma-70 family)
LPNGNNQATVTTTVASTPAASGGEETARLYRQYRHQLYRYCQARLRSREEAEDAVQSVFVRVHGALLKGVQPQSEAAWLYKIAHNVCLSRRDVVGRRERHESLIDPAELEWALAAYDAKPDELFALPAALAEMPKNLRDPFLLREWQGLSYAEIADALDTTVSAVETLIFRARRHLAAALAPPERRPLTARLLDTGWLYGMGRVALAQLRGLLTVAAPAKLAIGTAVLAVGGVGVEQAVVTAAADRTSDRSPRIARASTLRTPTPAAQRAPVAATAALAAAAATPTQTAAGFPEQTELTAHVGRAGGHPDAVPAAPPPPVPVDEPARAGAPAPAVPAAAAPAPTAPAAPRAPIRVVLPPVPSVPPAPAVQPPTVDASQLPAVPVPAVTVPTVTVPTVTVTVPAPTLP